MTSFRNVWVGWVVLFWGVIALPLEAQTSKTNQAAISYPSASVTFEPTERSEKLSERFLQEVVASDSIVFDRFTGPSSRLSWARRNCSTACDCTQSGGSVRVRVYPPAVMVTEGIAPSTAGTVARPSSCALRFLSQLETVSMMR